MAPLSSAVMFLLLICTQQVASEAGELCDSSDSMMQSKVSSSANTTKTEAEAPRSEKVQTQSPHCPPDFPNLYYYIAENFADHCRDPKRKLNSADNFRCPKGCQRFPEYPKVAPPYCIDADRNPCREETCWVVHSKFRKHSGQDHKFWQGEGNRCEPESFGGFIAEAFAEPLRCTTEAGCREKSSAPYLGTPAIERYETREVYQLKNGETETITKVNEREALAPWRVRGIATKVQGSWVLLASSTHGVEVSMEVGVMTSTGASLTESQHKTLTQSVSHTHEGDVSVDLPFKMIDAGVDYSYTNVNTEEQQQTSGWEKTVEDALSRHNISTITVSCPDSGQRDSSLDSKSEKEPRHTVYTTYENSIATEYVYQWVVSAMEAESKKEFLIKTEHFRCHRVNSGKEWAPECSPLRCGPVKTNAFCQAQQCLPR